MPYLASLDILDLTKITNNPILHDPTWPNMPTNLPSDIPKFEGKPGEDPTNHIMSFHLWCSSNSIMEYYVHLRLFQITLTGPSVKWYVDKKVGSHSTFESFVKVFLSFFQIQECHDTGLEILSEFRQTSVIHIVDHIHECQRRKSICKAYTTPQQRLDWFFRSPVPLLTKYVSTTFPQNEYEAITKAQYFDLIYAQSRYLYTILPYAPHPLPFGQDKPGTSHTTNGLIGSMTHNHPQTRSLPTFWDNPYQPPYGGTPYYPPPPH
jgi:hypothetical protein